MLDNDPMNSFAQIFWTDWRQNQVISADKVMGNDFTVLARINKPFSIRALHSLTQPLIGPSEVRLHSCLKNAADNTCSHICLPFPPIRAGKANASQFRCLCPRDSTLSNDVRSCQFGEYLFILSCLSANQVIKDKCLTFNTIIVTHDR